MMFITQLKTFITACQRMFTIRSLALMLGVMLGIMAPVLQAHAGFSSCQGDPVVSLSNGVVLDLSVSLDISASSVNQIVYTVHAPKGTKVVSVTYTAGSLQNKEVLNFVADQQSEQYLTDTFASTQINANVTAKFVAKEPGLLGGVSSNIQKGTNSQHLDVHQSLRGCNPGNLIGSLVGCVVGL
jgi:hypothetical protein